MATATAARRISRDDGYGRHTRFYEVPNGGTYVSVTAVLEVLAKPQLIGWAANQEREMVTRAAADLHDDLPTAAPKMSRVAYMSTLKARIGKVKAHVKELKKASDIGTQVHAKVEWTLRKELQQAVGPEPQLSGPALWAFMAWEDWRKESNLVPLIVEQTVWSAKYGYAGTLDLFAELDFPDRTRGRAVLDWKSGKAIYKESPLQNSAYVEALIEMGHAERPIAGMIVRLPKVVDDPQFEVKFIPPRDVTASFKPFLHALELWRWSDAL
jgi:hypothetical protein